MSSKRTTLIDILLWRPLHLFLGCGMIASVIFLQRNAFCIHVFGVTSLLLIVLHKINMSYGQLVNKFLMYEYVVVAGGFMHTLVPVVGMFYPIAMFVHLGICFVVHILHLLQCYQVFTDIHMNDTQYILILWMVNIFEFAVNFSYCFPTVISDSNFVAVLIGVEISALLISSLKLKGSSSHISVSGPGLSDRSNSQSGSSRNLDTGDEEIGISAKRSRLPSILVNMNDVANVLSSRLFVMFLAQVTVVLLLALRNVEYSIFITGMAAFLAVDLIKFHNKCPIPCSYMIALVSCTSAAMVLLAWLFCAGVVALLPAVVAIIVVSTPAIVLLLWTVAEALGNHYSLHVVSVATIAYYTANIYYVASGASERSSGDQVLETLMCCAVAGVMLFSISAVPKTRIAFSSASEKDDKHSRVAPAPYGNLVLSHKAMSEAEMGPGGGALGVGMSSKQLFHDHAAKHPDDDILDRDGIVQEFSNY